MLDPTYTIGQVLLVGSQISMPPNAGAEGVLRGASLNTFDGWSAISVRIRKA